MDIIATQAAWKQALDTLSPIRGGAATRPITQSLLVQALDTGLTLTRTDLERQLRAPLVAESCTGQGEIAIDARKLSSIIAALPPGATCRLHLTGGRAHLTTAGGGRVISRFTLGTLPGTDYPLMSLAREEDAPAAAPTRLRVAGNRLAAVLHATTFAMAKNDVRYYLNGILLEWASESLLVVATDGHRLAHVGLRAPHEGAGGTAIIPAETAGILARIGAEMGEAELTLELHPGRLAVAWRGCELLSKLIDGKYPEWRRVIPTPKPRAIRLVLPVADLLAALGRVKILSHEQFHGAALEITAEEPTSLSLRATNTQQDEAEETLALPEACRPGRWGFNIDYLLDVASHCASPDLALTLDDGSSPVLLGPATAGPDAEQDDPVWVVMPMLL